VAAKDVETYIANAGEEARPLLEELRALVLATIPEVEERISYGVPFYKHHGELAGFAVYTHHVSFGTAAAVLGDDDRKRLEDAGYKTGKKTIQVRFDQEVPAAAVEAALRAQARLNESR
jgi:uncharacterized protein